MGTWEKIQDKCSKITTDSTGLTAAVCADTVELFSQFHDNEFDLVVADPPYGLGMAQKKRTRLRKGNNFGRDVSGYSMKNWDAAPPDKHVFDELIRISKNQVIWGANHFISKIPYDSPCWLIWDKHVSGDFADCELAWTSFRTAAKKFDFPWNGFKMAIKEHRIHPTQKPQQLYEWIFRNYSYPGCKVLDPYMGSGSSRIAALRMGIEYLGVEMDEEYFDKHCEFFARHEAQERLFSLKEVEQTFVAPLFGETDGES